MSTPIRLGAFVVALVAVFAVAAGVGKAVGPVGSPVAADAGHDMAADDTTATDESHRDDESHGAGTEHSESAGPAGDEGHGDAHAPSEHAGATTVPAGLTAIEDGYTLELATTVLPAGPAVPLDFRILGPDGAALTSYERAHDKELHLIVARRDLTGFQHVHPVRAADGTWSTTVALRPGDWRVFADFTPGGAAAAITLGGDLAVGGTYDPQPLPSPAASITVDGYAVTLTGTLTPGEEAELTMSITRDGRPVTDLEPYLAAYGHLVVLRAGDLGYLHVHPAGEPGDGVTPAGPDVTFFATAPSAGDYALFLDFQHDGVVRTAALTVHAEAAADAAADAP